VTNQPTLWFDLVERLLVPLLIVIPILYLWAVGCFLCIRFYRPETQSRMKNFLEKFRPFFVGRKRVADHQEVDVTRTIMREAGSRGWTFIWLPAMCLSLNLSFWSVLVGIPVLFFGGLFFAFSWYGLRCLRVLGFDSY
jgi:hypothetical protein